MNSTLALSQLGAARRPIIFACGAVQQADLSVKKYRLAVLRAKGCAIATA
jgi:hypothetical protein